MKNCSVLLALFAAFLFALSSTAGAATIQPNDPSVSGNLIGWYSDPANNYSATTGVWSDSSGNENDTETNFSQQNGGAITFGPLGLSTSTPSNGLFAGETLDVVLSDSDNDLLRTPALNSGSGFSQLTIIAVLKYSNTGEPNRPVGIGSSNEQNGSSTTTPRLNPAGDGSVRFDNGNVTGSSVPTHYFIRGTVLDGDGSSNAALRDFFFDDSGLGFSATTNINGSYNDSATGTDVLFIGDVKDNRNGDGLAQVAIYNTALTNQQVSDIAEWMSENPNTVPEPSTFVLAVFGLLGLLFCGRRRKR